MLPQEVYISTTLTSTAGTAATLQSPPKENSKMTAHLLLHSSSAAGSVYTDDLLLRLNYKTGVIIKLLFISVTLSLMQKLRQNEHAPTTGKLGARLLMLHLCQPMPSFQCY